MYNIMLSTDNDGMYHFHSYRPINLYFLFRTNCKYNMRAMELYTRKTDSWVFVFFVSYFRVYQNKLIWWFLSSYLDTFCFFFFGYLLITVKLLLCYHVPSCFATHKLKNIMKTRQTSNVMRSNWNPFDTICVQLSMNVIVSYCHRGNK